MSLATCDTHLIVHSFNELDLVIWRVPHKTHTPDVCHSQHVDPLQRSWWRLDAAAALFAASSRPCMAFTAASSAADRTLSWVAASCASPGDAEHIHTSSIHTSWRTNARARQKQTLVEQLLCHAGEGCWQAVRGAVEASEARGEAVNEVNPYAC